MKLHFRWVREAEPGARWLDQFERAWPSYSDWFLREGDAARPGLATCRAKLHEYMPELLPLWERLVELARGDELVARMLCLYRPTPFLAGCSQAVWTRGAPMLVRNYDYHPAASEGLFSLTAWNGTRVLAASDCLWGVLDGMNEHGLVAALSFGGSRAVGDGFGIPLILRYVLQQCRTVAEAGKVLRRVPSHMAYNVSLLDAAGDYAVAALAPGRATTVRREAVAVNHQRGAEWKEYERLTQSTKRKRFLDERLKDEALTRDAFEALFLEPPLYSTGFDRGLGTLYTAIYHPGELRAEFLWPKGRFQQSFDDFRESEIVVQLKS